MSGDKEIIVVGGPNGAGKTTLARQLVIEKGYRYLGADEIAERMFPDNPSEHSVEAGRQFLSDLTQFVDQGENLIVESTLSGRSLIHRLEAAKCVGYRIAIAFTFLESADLCVARVQERVRKGGHDVPEVDVRRRYPRSLANFWNIYRPIADQWVLLLNVGENSTEIVAKRDSESAVLDELRYQSFLRLVRGPNEPD